MKNKTISKLALLSVLAIFIGATVTVSGCSSKGHLHAKKNVKVHRRKGLAPGMGN